MRKPKLLTGVRKFTAEFITNQGTHIKAEGEIDTDQFDNPVSEVMRVCRESFSLGDGKFKAVRVH